MTLRIRAIWSACPNLELLRRLARHLDANSPMENAVFVSLWDVVHAILARAKLSKVLSSPVMIVSELGFYPLASARETNLGVMSLFHHMTSVSASRTIQRNTHEYNWNLIRPSDVSPMFRSMNTMGLVSFGVDVDADIARVSRTTWSKSADRWRMEINLRKNSILLFTTG